MAGLLKLKVNGTFVPVVVGAPGPQGPPGPEGPQGPVGVANVTRIVYDSVNSVWPARPSGALYVEWVGPVAPTAADGAVDDDTWVNTA